jgi:hypothetical protein
MVLEGEGAINNVRQHCAKHPVVSVVDEIQCAGEWGRRSPAATQFGGQVLAVTPFTIQQGGEGGRASVGVQMQNRRGTSATATAHF